jgi:hypothetical protein
MAMCSDSADRRRPPCSNNSTARLARPVNLDWRTHLDSVEALVLSNPGKLRNTSAMASREP